MMDFYGKYLRLVGALTLALALGACATTSGPSIKDEVTTVASPTQALVMAADHLAALTRALPGAVDAMDSAGKCARTTNQLADALEAVVIAETRYMKAVPPTAPEPPGVHTAMQQLNIASQPQVRLAFQGLAAKCRLYVNDKRVSEPLARITTACGDIDQLERAYNAQKPQPKPPAKPSTKGKGKGKPTKHPTSKSKTKPAPTKKHHHSS